MGLVSDAQVRCSELMAAISLATDMGMAVPLETGLATCLVATSLAARMGAGLAVRQRAYQLALLQHIGCTAAASQVASVMGDELVMRAHAATLDFADHRQMLKFLLGHVARTSPPLGRPAALARAIAGEQGRGLSIRQMARELSIAPKTADGHLQRIYAKIGVSTRAGATLFALSAGLVPDIQKDRENSP